MGLDIYLYRHTSGIEMDDGDFKDPGEKIKIDSALHPDHMFKIGYLRSSYDEGGINRILKDRIGVDLYGIFGRTSDDYAWRPDWSTALANAEKALADLRSYRATQGDYRAIRAGANIFSAPLSAETRSEADALKLWQAERAKTGSFDCYSSRDGTFWRKDAPKLVALISGVDAPGFGAPRECVYAIVEGSELDWYEQALEVTAEMIHWVLAAPNPHELYLHWSS